jgi:hypothetical protein
MVAIGFEIHDIASGAGRLMSATRSDHSLLVLDGLRAISILLVLACHLLPLGPATLELNGMAGSMGMSLFFVLSGFLITSGLLRNPNVQEFVARRLARILPLVYAYTLVVFLVFTFQPKALFWTNLFTVNYFTQYLDPDWSAHLWSLCVEIHFYLTIALVVLLFGRRGLCDRLAGLFSDYAPACERGAVWVCRRRHPPASRRNLVGRLCGERIRLSPIQRGSGGNGLGDIGMGRFLSPIDGARSKYSPVFDGGPSGRESGLRGGQSQ